MELQGVVGEDGETVDEIENMILTVNFPFLDDIRPVTHPPRSPVIILSHFAPCSPDFRHNIVC